MAVMLLISIALSIINNYKTLLFTEKKSKNPRHKNNKDSNPYYGNSNCIDDISMQSIHGISIVKRWQLVWKLDFSISI
mgnify:FL=1